MQSSSAAHVPSPCTSVCTLSQQTGYCLGCFRTIEEIAQWGQMSSPQKQAVVMQLEARRQAAAQDQASARDQASTRDQGAGLSNPTDPLS